MSLWACQEHHDLVDARNICEKACNQSGQKMRRQTLVILAVALVPLLGFIIFSDVSSRHDRDLAVRANALLEAENAASEMAQLFEGARQLLDTLATSPSVRQGDWDACKEHLQRLISLYPQYVSL